MSLPRLFFGILFCSIAAVSFEIILTRVFSISLWYHFAFMVISIAMLGLGLSGTVLSLCPSLRNIKYLGAYAIALSIAMLAGYAGTNLVPLDPARFAWDRQQLIYIVVYYVLLAMPFFFFGLIVTTALSADSKRSPLMYGADLIGAGTGSAAAILLMSELGPESSIYVITLYALAGAVCFGKPRTSVAVIVLMMILAGMSPGFMKLEISPYKGLKQALLFPGAKHISTNYSGFSRVDIFESPMVRYAPGMSLTYLEPLPHQTGLSVDGSGINAITEAREDMSFLRYLPSALPYETAERHKILVVEPKGGLPVLLAREYGASLIEITESNPLIVDIVRKDFNRFSGGIYNRGVHKKIGRSHLISSELTYDLIDISLTGTVPAGIYGISEDYALTVEAFKQYLQHLTHTGVISLNMYLIPPPRAELKALSIILKALEESGTSQSAEHIVAIRSWNSLNLLIKGTPFTRQEITKLKQFSHEKNFDLVYYPGIRQEESNIYISVSDNAYYHAFSNLINPQTRSSFVRDYIFDIEPIYDNSPFFHHYLRLDRIREVLHVMGDKWQFLIEEGSLLPLVFIQVLVLSLILILLPALQNTKHTSSFSFLAYFALLGLAFMFVEIPLIQTLILPLENPSYAFAIVLASILISSGSGSILSYTRAHLRRPGVLLLLSILIVPYGFLLMTLARIISPYSLEIKCFIAFILVMPVSVLMGIPFPMGIRLLGKGSPDMIPWAWAINGCCSVIGPVLATIVALTWGFKEVLLTGAIMYTGAFMLISIEQRT